MRGGGPSRLVIGRCQVLPTRDRFTYPRHLAVTHGGTWSTDLNETESFPSALCPLYYCTAAYSRRWNGRPGVFRFPILFPLAC